MEKNSRASADPLRGIEQKVPPHLLEQLNALRKYEAQVLRELSSDTQLARSFVKDPASVLSQLKIPLGNQLREALKGAALQGDFSRPRAFCLPNGRKITATVDVRLMPHKAGKSSK